MDKSDVVYKSLSPLRKIEIKKCQNHFFLAEFGLSNSGEGSTISLIDNLESFSTSNKIYSSNLDDFGHLTCEDHANSLFFLKNTTTNSVSGSEIAELNFETKQVKVLTDLKNVTSIINMDGIILTYDNGKYYIIKGNADYKSVDSLKKDSPLLPTSKKVDETKK